MNFLEFLRQLLSESDDRRIGIEPPVFQNPVNPGIPGGSLLPSPDLLHWLDRNDRSDFRRKPGSVGNARSDFTRRPGTRPEPRFGIDTFQPPSGGTLPPSGRRRG